MNLSKHRNTKFVRKENLQRNIRTPLLDNEHEMVTEYKVGIHEVVKKKRRDVDKIPGKCFYYHTRQLYFSHNRQCLRNISQFMLACLFTN